MAQHHEWMFYELMWQIHGSGAAYPLPWWVQMYFRDWREHFDSGLFSSKEGAFSSNAYYRYWSMVGVKDHHQESLIGQAGEIEPVYDNYCLSHFLYLPSQQKLWFPQDPSHGVLTQHLAEGDLPIIVTDWVPPVLTGIVRVVQTTFATVLPGGGEAIVATRFQVEPQGQAEEHARLGVSVVPWGCTGFQRHDRAGRGNIDRMLTRLDWDQTNRALLVMGRLGPVFGQAPAALGTYGNGSSYDDPTHYLIHSPFGHLTNQGTLNQRTTAVDTIAGMCTAACLWDVPSAGLDLDVRLPVDSLKGAADLSRLRSPSQSSLSAANLQFWRHKLRDQGFRHSVPSEVDHLAKLYRACRANLLILSDHGEIHPGPTIYDSFWIRDSSVESIAAAYAGDTHLAQRQLGDKYPLKFNHSDERLGPVSLRGFFGGEHEKNDREWDSNGQALWAFGKFDRIAGENFGFRVFQPYVLEGARWLRDNRDAHGLLHAGWSAEHIGDKNKPHYWDDFWGIAGLYEAARLSERLGHGSTQELWDIYDSLRNATVDSILWGLEQQRRRGFWETFIPTGPGDVGARDSTMIGNLAYFHPCRLYMGRKLGPEVDYAARMTLETLWAFVEGGGFRHDSSWNCYGPYLTMQLAHSFLLIGDLYRMDQLLAWSFRSGFAQLDGRTVVQGAWNEQHCYPIAKAFAEVPFRPWYMGDIPHGWACAEWMTLWRDILLFEGGEDGADPHIYLAPGVLPHWLSGNSTLRIEDAPTLFGSTIGYELSHSGANRRVAIELDGSLPTGVSYRHRCRLGRVVKARDQAAARDLHVEGDGTVVIPPGVRRVQIDYA